MNNKKCHYCGFINFVNAEACRKCEAVLTAIDEESAYDSAPTYRGGVNAYVQPYATAPSFTFPKALAGLAIAVVVVGIIVWNFGILNRFQRIKWIEYRPDSLDFTVMMPNQPTRFEPVLTPLPGGRVSSHQFVSTVAGQGIAIFHYAEYFGQTIDESQAPQALDASLQEFLTQTNSTLVAKTPITYQGMPGLEFEVTPPAADTPKASRGYGKMFFSFQHAHLYVFSLTAAEGSDLLAGKDKFLNPQIPVPPPVRKLEFPKMPEFKNLRPTYQPGPDDFK